MYYMSKPNFNIRDTYHECVNLITTSKVRVHLESLSESVYQYSEHYEALAIANKLNEFDIPHHFKVTENVDNEWLVKLYKNYFRNSTQERCSTVYAFYSRIKNYKGNVELSRCCYCNSNQVQCLDHFLPESKFNALAVNPINLVPSCDYCNKNKHHYKPLVNNQDSVLIHPYYNDLSDFDWLRVYIRIFYNFRFSKLDINKIGKLTALNNNDMKIGLINLRKNLYAKKNIQTYFYVNKEILYTNVLMYKRIGETFIKTDLNTTFSYAANSFILDDIVLILRSEIFSSLPDEVIKSHFSLQCETLINKNGYSLNNWKVVLYKFLSKYDCGFRDFY